MRGTLSAKLGPLMSNPVVGLFSPRRPHHPVQVGRGRLWRAQRLWLHSPSCPILNPSLPLAATFQHERLVNQHSGNVRLAASLVRQYGSLVPVVRAQRVARAREQ